MTSVENIIKKNAEASRRLKENELIKSKEDALAGKYFRALEFLEDIGQDIMGYDTQAKLYNSYQEELELERTDFQAVRDTVKDFELKYSLWKSLYEWKEKTQK